MKEKVIELTPCIIYAKPRSRLGTTEDAFDIVVKGVLERVSTLKKYMTEGRKYMYFK